MSLESWKAEFFDPISDKMGNPAAVTHSIKKWEGLTKENLEKHGVFQDGIRLYDSEGSEFSLDSSTCALCAINIHCCLCPLWGADERGCDKQYHKFIWTGDPTDMLERLKQCR